jgi:hypothetical protein
MIFRSKSFQRFCVKSINLLTLIYMTPYNMSQIGIMSVFAIF